MCNCFLPCLSEVLLQTKEPDCRELCTGSALQLTQGARIQWLPSPPASVAPWKALLRAWLPSFSRPLAPRSHPFCSSAALVSERPPCSASSPAPSATTRTATWWSWTRRARLRATTSARTLPSAPRDGCRSAAAAYSHRSCGRRWKTRPPTSSSAMRSAPWRRWRRRGAWRSAAWRSWPRCTARPCPSSSTTRSAETSLAGRRTSRSRTRRRRSDRTSGRIPQFACESRSSWRL
mmetsp:Transcript_34283/g.90558  ORF Transcript_34283/g.90558 Transcript_34283/m.90558 type:complete len:234 (-) Transcript_34283:1256-1957(-)